MCAAQIADGFCRAHCMLREQCRAFAGLVADPVAGGRVTAVVAAAHLVGVGWLDTPRTRSSVSPFIEKIVVHGCGRFDLETASLSVTIM